MVYIISSLNSQLRTASRKVAIKYIGPLVVYKIIDPHNYLLMTLDGKLLQGLFEQEQLQPAVIRTNSGNVKKSDTTKAGNDSWFARIMTTSRTRKLTEGMIHLIKIGYDCEQCGIKQNGRLVICDLARRIFAKPLVLGTNCVKSTIMTHLYVGAIVGEHLRERNQMHKKGSLTSYQYDYSL